MQIVSKLHYTKWAILIFNAFLGFAAIHGE